MSDEYTTIEIKVADLPPIEEELRKLGYVMTIRLEKLDEQN